MRAAGTVRVRLAAGGHRQTPGSHAPAAAALQVHANLQHQLLPAFACQVQHGEDGIQRRGLDGYRLLLRSVGGLGG